MRVRVLLACSIAVAAFAMVATGCTHRAPAEATDPGAAASVALPAQLGGESPGSLLSASSLPTLDRRLSAAASVAARITYLSTSGVDGTVKEVSGTVFAPRGSAPEGGWPVIAYGHPTSGTRPECAPSLDPNLLGMSPTVTGLVKAGYLVAVSDYQGLGTLGTEGSHHPYLDATTEGYNLIDSVRAARKLVPDASARWAAFGGSQGGQAAWAANELAARYAPDLQLVGSASYSAPLAIDGFVDAALDGTLSTEQRMALAQILGALADGSPDFTLDDYRHGLAEEHWDVLLACEGPQVRERDELANRLSNGDLRPATPQAADLLRIRLQAMSLPQQPATAPILIAYGGRDQLVPAAWTDRALDAACRRGDIIQIELQPDRGHADVDGGTAFPWINQRFAGEPARNDCPAFIAAAQSPVPPAAPA